MTRLDRHADLFEPQRRRLQAVDYRMLGSRQDAEDVVQEIGFRFLASDLDTIETPHAWLVTAVTRACIDRLRRLKLERNAYPGPWLPEPWVEPLAAPSAQEDADRASDISTAFLLMLERLAPEERAAFFLTPFEAATRRRWPACSSPTAASSATAAGRSRRRSSRSTGPTTSPGS